MVCPRKLFPKALIVHSDRGVQYRSQNYIDFMKRHGARPSMSRKGNCWDNAPMESFFSRLKVELMGQLVRQLAVAGKQQQSAGVDIQPTDADPAPAC